LHGARYHQEVGLARVIYTPATLGSPRTTLLTTFDNGTSKVI
jgi:hypothetical protein